MFVLYIIKNIKKGEIGRTNRKYCNNWKKIVIIRNLSGLIGSSVTIG